MKKQVFVVLLIAFLFLIPTCMSSPYYKMPVGQITTNFKSIIPQIPQSFLGDWENIGLENIWVTSIAMNNDFLFVGTNENGVFRRNHNNFSWQYIGFKDIKVKDIYINPNFPDIVFLSLFVYDIINDTNNPHSLYKSNDNGLSWEPIDNGIMTEDSGITLRLPVLCVTSNPTNLDVIYATSEFHVFKTENGGENWSLVFGGGGGMGMHVVIVDTLDNNRVWAGGETGFFQPHIIKSDDMGVRWKEMTPWMGGDNAVYSIVVHPDNSDIVYIGTEGAVYKTYDSGENWFKILKPKSYPYFLDVLIDPLNHEHIIAGGTPNIEVFPIRIWESFDGGSSWCFHGVSINQGGHRVHSIIFDIFNSDIIYAGTQNGIWKYTRN